MVMFLQKTIMNLRFFEWNWGILAGCNTTLQLGPTGRKEF
jgi:hypothetical protein